MSVCAGDIDACMHTYIHTHTHAYMHAYTCIHTHIMHASYLFERVRKYVLRVKARLYLLTY